MAERAPVALQSRAWSCSELAKGARVCADMAGMDLCFDPATLSKEQLVQAIKDCSSPLRLVSVIGIYVHSACGLACHVLGS